MLIKSRLKQQRANSLEYSELSFYGLVFIVTTELLFVVDMTLVDFFHLAFSSFSVY